MTHIIRDDAEAIAVARTLADEFRREAATRDRERRLPRDEIERFSQSGLWAITVPREYGGAGVAAGTLAEVTALVSAADGSLGQIPQNHFFVVEAIRLTATAEQKRHWFGRVLDGERFGNALSETGTRDVHDYRTTLRRERGRLRLDGRKFYSTGALFAHTIAALAKDATLSRAGDDRIVFALVDPATPGVALHDDWTGVGQRTTGSGTTVFEDVTVDAANVIAFGDAFERPTPMGPLGQIIHAAVDIGIGREAIAETIDFVRRHARPWIDSGVERACDDPYTIAQVGELVIRQNAAEALLARAGLLVDAATREPDEETVARASVAVAEAKALATEAALNAANRLHELGGTRSTLAVHALDRHWRNVRTHTLHDPARWKYAAIGNYHLNGTKPPRHGAL
ncbi:SfnB family sulfur acquisition oxidoreductase [Lichenicoccus sp.]|uniref:SfnB family sulfur acquisition oxidoreductase n=1 Tax=Lichenicoccus sp. TaxID=2781899 RepID=UPI003D10E877